MSKRTPFVHPYIPNSTPTVKRQMLQEVGADSVEDFYEDIPHELRLLIPQVLYHPSHQQSVKHR